MANKALRTDTHTEQLIAAVVCVPSENQLVGIGIDAEPCEGVDTSLYPKYDSSVDNLAVHEARTSR